MHNVKDRTKEGIHRGPELRHQGREQEYPYEQSWEEIEQTCIQGRFFEAAADLEKGRADKAVKQCLSSSCELNFRHLNWCIRKAY